jgi:hypothetical protein
VTSQLSDSRLQRGAERGADLPEDRRSGSGDGRDASYWFCSERCRDRFDSKPDRFAGSVTK